MHNFTSVSTISTPFRTIRKSGYWELVSTKFGCKEEEEEEEEQEQEEQEEQEQEEQEQEQEGEEQDMFK